MSKLEKLIKDGISQLEMMLTIAGIFCGSVLWTFILCGTVAKIRHKASERWC